MFTATTKHTWGNKILSALLTIALLVSILPVIAPAATAGGVTTSANPSTNSDGLVFYVPDGKFYLQGAVIGMPYTPSSANEYLAQSGAWNWDDTTKTLSLNGFNYETDAQTALRIIGNSSNSEITINLTGTNTFLAGPGQSQTSFGVICDPDFSMNKLTITGGGTLNAFGGSTTGASTKISSTGLAARNLVVASGTVNAGGDEAKGESAGISVYSFELTGGTVNATAKGNSNYSNGLTYADFSMAGGTLIALGENVAIYGASPTLPEAYTYWTNNTPSAPSGAGTVYYPGSGAAAYSYSPPSSGDKYVKIAPGHGATVGNATVGGTAGKALTAKTATITLYGDTVRSALSSVNAKSWFAKLPGGVTVTATATAGAGTIKLTFGGTPTAASTAAFDIIIPANALTSGTSLGIQSNANAKFNIAAAPKPAPTPSSKPTPTKKPTPTAAPTPTPVVKYKVTLNANGGKFSGGKASKVLSVVKGKKVGTLTNPARKGYEFMGYYTKKIGGAKVTSSLVINKNTALYAHWARTGTVNTKSTKLHLRKTVAGKIIAKYAKGTKVIILGADGSWYKVQAGKKIGYMYKKYVRLSAVK